MISRTHWVVACVVAVWLGSGWGGLGATSKTTKKASTSNKSVRNYTKARNPYLGAIVVDAETGQVLFEERADEKGYPASVLKLMDLLIVLERIEKGQLSLQDQVPISKKAAATGGTQIWADPRETFTVDELLAALMVQSANDAAVALAEKVAGTTEGFLELMNRRARELGMTSTIFNSVHGLPPSQGQQDDITTARDLSILCRELVKRPEALRYTSMRERTLRGNTSKPLVMRTHNHLLSRLQGCDGLKTGYIAKSGFSIAVSAARGGRRIVVVVFDSADSKTRDAKAVELAEKGFSALVTPGTASARK